ncbi:SURP and G-patch domain-containing protein 2-like isoform X2 [Ambystoma mexicanum]|uniref:SURP and G-patch domain-containing protein 2-like isoform X2 n=1 Tax=Ambystoma mexicanum TaxID=8296 RepID=UPI0037E73DD7
MDYIPDDIFKDLMLDVFGTYDGHIITPSNLQGIPEPLSQSHIDREQHGSDGFSPVRKSDTPEKDSILGVPAESDKQASHSGSVSLSLDSRREHVLQGHLKCQQPDSPPKRNEKSSNSFLGLSHFDFSKERSSIKHADHLRSACPPVNKAHSSDSRTESSKNSRNVTSLIKHVDRRRSRSPVKGKVQAPDSLPVSPSSDIRKETSSLKHADRRRSSSPSESKGKSSRSRSELKRGDDKKDNILSGHSDHRQSSSPAESKKTGSTRHTETTSNRENHTEEHPTRSEQKSGPLEGNLRKEVAAIAHKIEAQIMQAATDSLFQKLKDKMEDPNFLTFCGEQLIKWADLTRERTFISDSARGRLDTETFQSLITAFKCPATPEQHKYCFSKVGEDLIHPTFQSPTLDTELFSMWSQSSNSEARTMFLNKIYPLDKDLEKIQHLIMRATLPLFLVCNSFEVSSSIIPAWQRPNLLTAVLMCRHSLVLFGQIFSLISSLRQEKVLGALNLHGKPPQPSRFPNLDNSCLFGQKYMAILHSFMKKGQLVTAGSGTTAKRKAEHIPQDNPKGLIEHVDSKTKVSIDKLASFIAEMGLGMEVFNLDVLASNPNFWFLNAEQSSAYKLYQKRLSEFRQSLDCQKHQDLASKETQPGDHQPLQKNSNSSSTQKTDCFTPPLLPPPRKRKTTLNAVSTPTKKVIQEEIPKVDAKTRNAAEKLARFIVRMGPEMERFTKAEASNPEFWFLNQKDHPAYKFYQMKLAEFSKARQEGEISNQKPLIPVKSSTKEEIKSANPELQNPNNQAAESHSALLLLSELYDSDEEDSESKDRTSHDRKHQSHRHHRSRSQTNSATRNQKRTSSKRDSHTSIRCIHLMRGTKEGTKCGSPICPKKKTDYCI